MMPGHGERAVAAEAGTMPASSRHSRNRSSRTVGFTSAVTTGVMEASQANALAAWPSSHAAPSPPTTDGRRAYYGGMETLRGCGSAGQCRGR
jgi:hypothetical protein